MSKKKDKTFEKLALIDAVNNSPIEKEYLLYMNFDINTNVKERSAVFNAFEGKDFVLNAERKPFEDYLTTLSFISWVRDTPKMN